MDCETIIAIVGICASSVFAGVGLLFNYFALNQNNKIAISTKLSEASKLLSNELLLQVRLWKYYESESREIELMSSNTNKNPEALSQLIAISLSRQAEIDKETEEINQMFFNSKKLDLNKIDHIISESYRLKTKALHQLEFIKEQKIAPNNASQGDAFFVPPSAPLQSRACWRR